MIQRIAALTRYFSKTLLSSLSGLLYLLVTLAYWYVLFKPQQGTSEVAYYQLVIGVFGTGMAFLITLSIAARANTAEHYPFLVRLPSRVEFVTAVLSGSLIVTFAFQLLLAGLALISGPSFTIGQLLEIPPIWIAPIILSAVLALHASDFITIGWSRIYIFGILAVLLFGQGLQNQSLAKLANSVGRLAINQGWTGLSGRFADYADRISQSDQNVISRLFGFVFWPFEALATAVTNGYFSANQALAPAILLLYATVLFLLAADLFANKDLEFTE